MNSAKDIAIAVCAKNFAFDYITDVESCLIHECDCHLTYHRSIRPALVPLMMEKAENELARIRAAK